MLHIQYQPIWSLLLERRVILLLNSSTTIRKISGAHETVERCIGIIRGRWGQLKQLYCLDCEDACQFIVATCVLHNMCILAHEDNNDL